MNKQITIDELEEHLVPKVINEMRVQKALGTLKWYVFREKLSANPTNLLVPSIDYGGRDSFEMSRYNIKCMMGESIMMFMEFRGTVLESEWDEVELVCG